MSTENEITTAHAMHFGSLKTAEILACRASQAWSTNQLVTAEATMQAIIEWSRQMQAVVGPLSTQPETPTNEH